MQNLNGGGDKSINQSNGGEKKEKKKETEKGKTDCTQVIRKGEVLRP